MADTLATYRAKRDFSKTAEPKGSPGGRGVKGNRYLVQKHDASRLHFDFRLEMDGVLLSWAVTKGPSLDPQEKRLAVHVEDHPVDYGDFEGTIPKGEYGGGTVMLWDEGTWEPIGDAKKALAKGSLDFTLNGKRLQGRWHLVRMRARPGERSKRENWLLIKGGDDYAKVEKVPIIERQAVSVRSGRTMEEIAAGPLEWTKDGPRKKKHSPSPAPDTASPSKGPTPKKGRAARLPDFVPPQLATLVDAPPSGDEWLHEIKYDGYRAIAAVADREARIFTRSGLDWTDKFASTAAALKLLPCRSALLDGEIAVADSEGRTDFGALQVALGKGGAGATFYVFDLLALDGIDLRKAPLLERKHKLAALLSGVDSGPVLYSDHVVGHGDDMFKRACTLGLEGIVSKRANAPYVSTRASTWLKVKCGKGQEFIIAGWRPSDVKGRPFSSILLAVREGDRLVYRGRVGSGFGDRELRTLWPELKKRAVKAPQVEGVPKAILRHANFVKPDLVAEIAFRGWTREGFVRQGSFKGLRADKRPAEIVAEKAVRTTKVAKGKVASTSKSPLISIASTDGSDTIEIEGVRVTHPDRVLYSGTGVTKRMLINYYLRVADLMLPHVAERPLSLVRCPDGADGKCFFQKHAAIGFPRGTFHAITIKEFSGSDQYLYIEDRAGLVSAVQMGALELHVWGSKVSALETPDRMVFDFDPDESLDFERVKTAAREMKDRLAAIHLQSFLMASGGKGLHVVVPLRPGADWDYFKNFAEAMARAMAADSPQLYLATMSKAARKGRIFIDYLRNGRGATAIGPYSSRARPGASVAWPLSWRELPRLDSAHPVSIDAIAMTGRKSNPWEGYGDLKQKLPEA